MQWTGLPQLITVTCQMLANGSFPNEARADCVLRVGPYYKYLFGKEKAQAFTR
jgi:hypothetical protein